MAERAKDRLKKNELNKNQIYYSMEYYLSEEKIAELKTELTELRTVRKSEVAERLQKAKELGDLSENSEYFEAREEQGQMEQRIFELEQILKNVSIIKKPESHSTVLIGSTTELEKNGTRMTFTIVGSSEAKPEEGLISNESPLGKALLGKKAGETVTVKAPIGNLTYKITKIE